MRKTYIFVFIYKYAYDGQDVKQTNGSVGTYIKDHHGNIIGGRSKSGTMFADKDNCMEYDAFGNKRNKNIPAPFGYCGEYTDAESGLVYLRNRYYDTTTGRFITEDPYWNIDNMIYGDSENRIPDMSSIMQSANLYNYVLNNPVNGWDSSGFRPGDQWLDATDFYPVAEEITNIIANQIYYPTAANKNERHTWANQARYALKNMLMKNLQGQSLPIL